MMKTGAEIDRAPGVSSPSAYEPLDPSEFSFHGFDDLMTPLSETVRSVGIRRGQPAVSVVEDAVYVPSRRVPALVRSPERFFFEGGLVTRDGQSINLALSRRRGGRWGDRLLGKIDEPMVVAPERVVDEEVVYLGWYFKHFGHFLSESLARTWFLDQVEPSTKVVFHTMREATPSGTTQRILEAFGIPLDRVLIFEEPVTLRRVIIPEQLYEISVSAHEWMPRPYRRVASRIVDGGSALDQPVYLSRRLLPGHLRQIVGEFEMEEILRENGFRIAYPETMSFEDQVQLVNQHSNIFTSAGSAAYNVLFALSGPTLHFLTCGIPRQDYLLTPKVANASASYSNCFGRGGRPSINTTPLLVETSKLVDYLNNRGFLKKRLRASLAGRAYGMQETFDKEWFYATVRDIPRGESLSAEIEQEVLSLARTSWPLSWMLAQYASLRDPVRVDDLAKRFIELVSAEPDISQLAKYQEDIESAAWRVAKHCHAETAACLTSVLASLFLIDATKRRNRGDEPVADIAPRLRRRDATRA